MAAARFAEHPLRRKERDGIYPRCVWCGHENYMFSVIAYSSGDCPCAAVPSCGRYLPADYIKTKGK